VRFDCILYFRFDKLTKLDNLLLGDYDMVSVVRKMTDEYQCAWQFEYVHYNEMDETTGLTEECVISIEHGNVQILRSSKQNGKEGKTAKWVFE